MNSVLTESAQKQDDRTLLTYSVDTNSWTLAPIRAAFGAGTVHFCSADGLFDLARVAETFGDKIVRSWFKMRERPDGGPGGWYELAIRLDEKLYVLIDEDSLAVYSDSAEKSRETVERLRKAFLQQSPPPHPTFQIVKYSCNTIETESVRLGDGSALDTETLALHYGPEFPGWHETFVQSLRERPTGLSIFDGPPGTGKTSYLRHVMAELKESHRFYFISSSNLRLLRDSEFVDFWASERRTFEKASMVVILEDAEAVLMPRSSDNRQEVSLLLNITDGILGEFLRLQVVCTINCSLKELDPALLRPGRLTAHRYFGMLDYERAAALAGRLGKKVPDSVQEYTLAEIFSGQRDSTRRKRGAIGFGARAV